MRISITLIIMMICVHMASAQMSESCEKNLISMTGTCEMEVTPNIIVVVFTLREFEENKQKVTLQQLETQFEQAIKKSNTALRRLTLADVGASLLKVNRREKDIFREKQIEIVFTSASELENCMQQLNDVKLGGAVIKEINHSDIDSLKQELRVRATRIAKANAESVLKSIGSSLGRVNYVAELWTPMIPVVWDLNPNYQASRNSADNTTDRSFRKMKLTSSVTCRFEIL